MNPAISTVSPSPAISRNHAIDVFRFLAAFCVVALHSPLNALPNSMALAIRLGSRWAVPYFFLISGYFIAQSVKIGQPINFSKSINNLVAIFIIANLFYCLFYIIDADASTNIKLTVIGLLVGQSGHLWYIGSTIFGLIILQYLAARYSDKVLLLVSVWVLLVVLVGSGYSGISKVYAQFDMIRYITSIPFLFTGFLLARHRHILNLLSVKVSLFLIILGFGIELTEAVLLYKVSGASPHNQEMLLGIAVSAIGFFGLSMNYISNSTNLFSNIGKKYSLLIYLYHPIIISLLFSIMRIGYYNQAFYWASPLITFLTTLFILKVTEKIFPVGFKVISGQ